MHIFAASEPSMHAAVARIRDLLISSSRFEQPSPAPKYDGQSIHDDSHEHILSKSMDCDQHISFAQSYTAPDNDNITKPHLIDAANYVASFATHSLDLKRERLHRVKELQDIAQSIQHISASAAQFCPKINEPLLARFNPALIFAMQHATAFPDDMLAEDLVLGVPNIGDIPASKQHAPANVPQKLDVLDPSYAAKLIGSIRRKAKRAKPADSQGLRDCYDKTLQEVKDGWMIGPLLQGRA